MELRQIRTFNQVARLQSFSAAAEALNLAQSAVSRQVRALEEEFQTQLIFRTTRRVVLTEAGQLMLAKGGEILALADQLKEAIIQAPGSARGTVTVGIPPSLTGFFATPLLEECRQFFPDIDVHVEEGLPTLVEEWLAVGRIDLGIVSDKGTKSRFAGISLGQEEFVLVSDPRQIESQPEFVPAVDLPALNIIVGRGYRELIDPALADHGLKIDYARVVDNIQMIREMLARGPLHTILSEEIVRRWAAEGNLQISRIREPVLIRKLVLADNPQRPNTPAMRAVRGLLTGWARSHL
ncbi:LysR family transcriptional regulator [Roseiarcaceae bacterium H3SJ34-1]|uniref:LysR family transcriptional regulator n=1 Tax=Terripilifer ovatus TaxID=3032367 RepID=UPI003AB91C03|nr:LysR family transcriptional regulator [Roseiarcaceae bacterium H3SJ34-1]